MDERQKYIDAIEPNKLARAIRLMQDIADIANMSDKPLERAAQICGKTDNDIDYGCILFDVNFNDKYVFTLVLNEKKNKVRLSSNVEINILDEKGECEEYFAYQLTNGYLSDMNDAENFHHDTVSELYNTISL